MLWIGIIASLVCKDRNPSPSYQKQPSVSCIPSGLGIYFDVITTSALDDIIGSIEGNPLFWPSFASLILSIRIAMVSTKYLCHSVDDIAAVYSFADLKRLWSVSKLHSNELLLCPLHLGFIPVSTSSLLSAMQTYHTRQICIIMQKVSQFGPLSIIN